MIVNIRGTSGSGKSTIVRAVMELYDSREPIMVDWRKRPLGYFCYTKLLPVLFVPGHYEAECGGCDTLPALDFMYHIIRKYADEECDVLFEGLIVVSDWKRARALHDDKYQFHVIGLSTSLKDCLAAVQDRRNRRAAAKGKEALPLNPAATNGKHRCLVLQEAKFKGAKVPFEWQDRAGALTRTKELLGW